MLLVCRSNAIWVASFWVFSLGPVDTETVVSLVTFQVHWGTFPRVPGLSLLPHRTGHFPGLLSAWPGLPDPSGYTFLLILLIPGYTGQWGFPANTGLALLITSLWPHWILQPLRTHSVAFSLPLEKFFILPLLPWPWRNSLVAKQIKKDPSTQTPLPNKWPGLIFPTIFCKKKKKPKESKTPQLHFILKAVKARQNVLDMK